MSKVKKKDTVRISQKDLLKLLDDNDKLKKQVTVLQVRYTELIYENKELKKQIESHTEWTDTFDRNIYDGVPEKLPNHEIYIDGATHP